MSKKNELPSRQTLLFASTIAALGVSLGVPSQGTLAETVDKQIQQTSPTVPLKIPAKGSTIGNQSGNVKLEHPISAKQVTGMDATAMPVLEDRPVLIRPHRSVEKLVGLAQQALTDRTLAERIYREPDAVAAQYNLSDNEKRVLRHMNREQFQVARTDATKQLDMRKKKYTPAAFSKVTMVESESVIAARMVVGRSILAAVGKSYLSAADAHNCCPWGKSIELGLSSSPGFYNAVFERPAMNAIKSSPAR